MGPVSTMAASATGVAIPATSILGANPQNGPSSPFRTTGAGDWGRWCLAAIQSLLQLPTGGFGNAISAFEGYKNKGLQVNAPLPGDMVFFGPSSGNGNEGHVGIVNGDGTYTSVLNDGNFHVLPLPNLGGTSLGASMLGFISSAKAGVINPFAALGKLKARIGGITVNPDGQVVSQGTGNVTTTGVVGDVTATGGLVPSLGDPLNPPRPPGTYTSTGKCPPTPPGNKVYNDTIDLPGGKGSFTVPGLQAIQQIGDYFGYLASYFGCIVGSIVNFFTTPGYWWRAAFVLAGLALVFIGGRTYLAGDLPSVVQSIGK